MSAPAFCRAERALTLMAHPLFALSPAWRNWFWASYCAWVALDLWIFTRDRRAVRGDGADRGSLFVIVAAVVASLVGAFYAAYVLAFARIGGNLEMVFVGGVSLIWAGIALRLWAVLTLSRFFKVSVIVQDDHQLVTHGPYRWLRHPAYAGSLASLAGVGLALGNWISLLICVGGLLLAYVWRIRVEEAALRRRFGAQFDDYAARRRRIIPLLW
jgi:protein-S-isoprenylcysteine O-methyltransferase Ste14